MQGADTVILFDPDWNPQTDLQAIDRAHRIGQKKQVQVFRLITENTVDEFIVQRAEVKLRLRNKIIEQGRTFDNSKIGESEKRNIIGVGIDSITALVKADITGVNLNELITYSQRKTHEESEKLKKLNEIELRNMKLKKSVNTPVNRSQTSGNDCNRVIEQSGPNQLQNVALKKSLITPDNHGQKTANDSNRAIQQSGQNQLQTVALKKSPITSDNHGHKTANDSNRLIQASSQNHSLLPNRENHSKSKDRTLYFYQFYPMELIAQCDANRLLNMNMSTNTKVNEALLAQGFPNWSLIDYKIFCDAVQKFGRFDLASVAEMMIPSKDMDDIAKYHEVFFRRGPVESEHIRNVIKNVKLAELKNRNRVEALRWKMFQFGKSEFEATLTVQKQHAKFTLDHDRYLICAVSRYGSAFNVHERVIGDIRYVHLGSFTVYFQ